MQIPILNGIYTDNSPNLRTSYPVNLMPVPKKSGISNGFLRPADGLVANGTGPGVDRGGINWNGVCYPASRSRIPARPWPAAKRAPPGPLSTTETRSSSSAVSSTLTSARGACLAAFAIASQAKK